MHYTSRIIIDNKLQMLESMIYQDIHPISNWETRELLYPEPLRFEPLDDWHPIQMGDHWRSRFDHTRLFRTRITIPHSFAGKQVMLVLDLGGEGQVRINGEIVSGITSYENGSFLGFRLRSRVYVPEKYKPGDTIEVEAECCLNFLEFSASPDPLPVYREFAEYTLKTAFMAVVNEDLERYYFDLRCAAEALDTFANPLDTLQHSNARILDPTVRKIMMSLNTDSYLHEKIFKACMESLNHLELEFGYKRLCASVPAASRTLCDALNAIPHKAAAMVKFVGQSHIDTAWLWPLKETVRKCGKTFSNTIALMEKYPEYIFAFSQPQLFAYTEEFYPELFEKVKERVLEGRIELVGNAWVEMDSNVPSGEALVRQLLYGRQYFLDKFGKASRIFWMPDVFGYSWALPQIMKRSGIDYFFTSKLSNNDTNNFPHSLFLWQGVDGTRILSYLQRLNYNGELDAATLSEIYRQFDQKDVCDTVLMTIGYGDGGGGPSYQMLEKATRLKNFPGLPQSEFATSESFFEEAQKYETQLPVWNDEMYYEFHRGTYTSQANTKKNNRKGELLLQRTEMACTMAHILLDRPYPAKAIGDIWKPLLTNQFHDILPGSSIHQVYEDCDRIYKKIFADANALYEEALGALNASIKLQDNQIAVWNFLGWNNTGIVTGRVNGIFDTLTDVQGNPVDAQVKRDTTGTVFTFRAEDIPPMGVKVYTAVPAARAIGEPVIIDPSAAPVTALQTGDNIILENTYLKLTLDKDGNISGLYDKSADREVLAANSRSNLLTVFEDISHRESAWNIDIEYLNHYWPLEKADSVELTEVSTLRAIVRTVRSFNQSVITQDLVLEKDAHRVDFVTHVDWQETQRMLKAAFYADVLSPKATYEIQFGAIERPTHWNTSYDKARFEVCGHKWADLSEGLYGVSILNDCKYGYDIKDNCLRLTLLRSPNYPDPVGDKGIHNFTYSIYPHRGDWRTGETVHEAFRLNVPLQASVTRDHTPALVSPVVLPDCFAFVSVDHSNVIIDTIKGAEDGDGMIVRVYESQGARCKATLTFGFHANQATACNLMEVNEEKLILTDNTLSFHIKPYEIKTFRIRK